ncbi:MAG: CopD family protein [Halobacteriovoraceae bacterium]|nr:CopD family protein [Halobacteriovoraceae bacterium]
MYELIKSLHIIFVVTWFAGLFYIVRLFIYFAEADLKGEPERSILKNQFKIMQKRLWLGITWPSAILTAILGPWMILEYGSFDRWIHIKLVFVILLYLYHYFCHRIFADQQNDKIVISPQALRIYNEVATVLLFTIVFLAVFKDDLNFVKAGIGIVSLMGGLYGGIKLYKRIRER